MGLGITHAVRDPIDPTYGYREGQLGRAFPELSLRIRHFLGTYVRSPILNLTWTPKAGKIIAPEPTKMASKAIFLHTVGVQVNVLLTR